METVGITMRPLGNSLDKEKVGAILDLKRKLIFTSAFSEEQNGHCHLDSRGGFDLGGLRGL